MDLKIKIDKSAIRKLDKIVEKENLNKIIRLKNSLGGSWGGGAWSVVLDEQKEDDKVIEVQGYKIVMTNNVYEGAIQKKSFNIYNIFSMWGCKFGVV